MDITVLERQQAVLQRLYEQSHRQETDYFTLDSVVNHQQQVLSNANNWQCNSILPNKEANSSIKKRKAEFEIEEEENKGKGVEAEEAAEEKSEITTKTERETSANNSSKASEVQKPDYIHVRARRGQATDSHSLAERARREKISKKMKCLQDLVPGCNKVTGKAGMLDEIINYVQSLQKQVEFLSMKLATINPRLEFSVDDLFADKIPAYIGNLPTAGTQFEATSATCFEYNSDISMDQSQMLPQKSVSSTPTPDMFLDSSSLITQLQQLSGWESDLQDQFNIGFH